MTGRPLPTAPADPTRRPAGRDVLSPAARRRAREEADPEAGAAMFLVIMLMVVVGAMGLLITASVLQQVKPAMFAQKNTRTVFAAESGLQTGLSQLRSASRVVGGQTLGDPSRLPCSMRGAVGDPAALLTYDVKITYFTEDPSGRDASWLAAHALTCSTTKGLTGQPQPTQALLTSSGLDRGVPGYASTAGDRELVTTYTFSVDTAHVLGGLFLTSTRSFCLQAASAAPGSAVSYAARADCVADAPLQTWVYDRDYAIKLGSTVGSGAELCLTTSVPAGGRVTLQPCIKTPGDGSVRQLFSYEGGAKFRTQNSTNTNYGDSCLWAGSRTVTGGSGLYAGPDGCNSSNDDWGSWSPEPRVGAGAAGKDTDQIVNYQQFGRCMDVTSGQTGSSYMIVYPCKQDPSRSGKLNWNHRWYYQEDVAAGQPITVRPDGGSELCLTTPAANASPAFVVFRACSGAAEQQFVRAGDVGTYAASWTFTDSLGRCLSLGPDRAPAGNGVVWATIVAARCSGGPEQKWNAPANADRSGVNNTREVAGG